MSNRARYECCDLGRRNAVEAHATLNGIEALEVIDRDLPLNDPATAADAARVFPGSPSTGAGLSRDNAAGNGWRAIARSGSRVGEVASAPPPQLAEPGEAETAAVIAALANPDHVLVVRVANAGDYSRHAHARCRRAG